MSEHIYEAGWVISTTAAAGPIGEIIPATLATAKRPPIIREIGIFVSTPAASVAIVGIGRPGAIGITPGSLATVQALDSMDTIAGNTTVATTWGTKPTSPTIMRRFDLQAVAGAGVIFQYQGDEFKLWSGATINTLVVWQLSTSAVTYDCYVKVAE